jgi:hypothetical protein
VNGIGSLRQIGTSGVLAFLTTLVVGLGPAAARPPIAPLCNLAEPLDQLFGCSATQPQSTGHSTSTAPALRSARGPVRSPTRPRYVANRILVTFLKHTPPSRIGALLARAHAKQVRRIGDIGVAVLSVPATRRGSALQILSASRWVESAQRDPVVQSLDQAPNDAYWPDQWGLRTVGLPGVWNLTHGSGSVVVAVVDTGIDPGHPDLQGALLPGVDLVNGTASATDDEGHGTAVAGVIAARTNNQIGQAGICWSCTILPLKALNAQGIGDDASIAAAIVRATDAGARIINLSLGGPDGSDALAAAVSYALERGVLVIAAAGNSGSSTPFYPAAYPGVISVAGADTANKLYPWSNYGPWVTVAAPGCNVAPVLSGGYGAFCGTSSAAPVVAGIAALALAADPSATSRQVAAALEQGTVPLSGAVRSGRVAAPAVLGALGIRVPSNSSTATYRGLLSLATRARTYRRAMQRGTLTIRLAFTGPQRLTLTFADARGRLLARRTAASPLVITRTVGASTPRVTVAAPRARKVRFVLALTNTPVSAP